MSVIDRPAVAAVAEVVQVQAVCAPALHQRLGVDPGDVTHRAVAGLLQRGDHGRAHPGEDAHRLVGQERLRLQRSTAYKATIYIGAGEQLGSVIGLAASAIKNGDLLCQPIGIFCGHQAADISVHFLRLLRGSGFTGANGPYRLVGQYKILNNLFRKVI